jgi:hypothetical protein
LKKALAHTCGKDLVGHCREENCIEYFCQKNYVLEAKTAILSYEHYKGCSDESCMVKGCGTAKLFFDHVNGCEDSNCTFMFDSNILPHVNCVFWKEIAKHRLSCNVQQKFCFVCTRANFLIRKQKEEKIKRELKISRNIASIEHASGCNGLCNNKECRRVRGYLAHAKKCDVKKCVLCNTIARLIKIHIKTCKKDQCSVPECNNMRPV